METRFLLIQIMILRYITKFHTNVVIYKLKQQNLFKLDELNILINPNEVITLHYKDVTHTLLFIN